MDRQPDLWENRLMISLVTLVRLRRFSGQPLGMVVGLVVL